MQITEHHHRTLLLVLDNVLFQFIDLRAEGFVRIIPNSIEIKASDISPIISMDYSIRI